MKPASLFFLALVLLAIPTAIAGQRPTEQESTTTGVITDHSRYHWSNGKAWKTLDGQSKIMQVEGIENGMMLLLRESYPRLSASDRSTLETAIDRLTISGFRMSDIVEQIDDFYSDSSNARIPISDAYEYAMKKMHGSNQRELGDYVARLRATYNQ
jgi:hypothetical protein